MIGMRRKTQTPRFKFTAHINQCCAKHSRSAKVAEEQRRGCVTCRNKREAWAARARARARVRAMAREARGESEGESESEGEGESESEKTCRKCTKRAKTQAGAQLKCTARGTEEWFLGEILVGNHAKNKIADMPNHPVFS